MRSSNKLRLARRGMISMLATIAMATDQSPIAAAKKWIAPRTPDGQPDLQGIWTNATITPLERPKELAGKEFFTKQEAAEYEEKIVEDSNRDRRGRDAEADLRGAYNELWFDRGAKVDPANVAGSGPARREESRDRVQKNPLASNPHALLLPYRRSDLFCRPLPLDRVFCRLAMINSIVATICQLTHSRLGLIALVSALSDVKLIF